MTGDKYRVQVRVQKDKDCKDAWRLWGIPMRHTSDGAANPESKFTDGAVRMARQGRTYLLIADEANHTVSYHRLRKEMMEKRRAMRGNTYMRHLQEYVDAMRNYHQIRSRLRED